MDTIDGMRTFLAVVTEGSFVGGARKVKISPALASKYVGELESRLRVRLLNRKTRSLSVTELGNEYVERCQHVLEQYDELKSAINVVSLSGTAAATLDEQVSHLLRSAHKRASSLFSGGLNDHQLTTAQYFAMARLHEVGQLSQNHLGRLTAMDPATIQGVIQRLKARGLIERNADKNDRRRKVLNLTTSGRSTIERLRALAQNANDAILAPLNPGEREVFLRLLKRLA